MLARVSRASWGCSSQACLPLSLGVDQVQCNPDHVVVATPSTDPSPSSRTSISVFSEGSSAVQPDYIGLTTPMHVAYAQSSWWMDHCDLLIVLCCDLLHSKSL